MSHSAPFAAKKPSRRQRKVAAERARARREALEAAALADMTGLGGRRSLTGADPNRPLSDEDYIDADWEPVEPRWLVRFTAAVVATVLVGFLAFFEGFPVYGRSWHVPWAAGAGLGAVTLGCFAASYARRCARRRGVTIVSAVAGLVVVCLFVGMFTTTEIAGHAYLNWSTTARADNLALHIRSDLYMMAGYDALLTDDQATARAHYSSYAPAAAKMSAISSYYSNLAQNPSALPSPQFLTIIQQVSDAGYWGAKALTAKANDIIEPDATNEANISSWRQTFVGDVLAAGPELGHLASLYGINLTGSGGPTE